MSTRSLIGIQTNTCIIAAYCHCDGYIEGGVGDTLKMHYNSYEKTLELVNVCQPTQPDFYIQDQWGHEFSVKNTLKKEFMDGNEVKAIGLTPATISSLCQSIASTKFNVKYRPREKTFESKIRFILHGKDIGVDFLYLFQNGVWNVSTLDSDFVTY